MTKLWTGSTVLAGKFYLLLQLDHISTGQATKLARNIHKDTLLASEVLKWPIELNSLHSSHHT